jgi:rhomboid family GlyGly-CTERM serine protease
VFAKSIRTYPVTIFIAVASLITASVPALRSLFELNFALVADGQWWRVLSGHWTHYEVSHLFWDLMMFVALSAICEHRHRHWYAPAFVISLMLISAAIAITCPDISTYRGLSGIDTGLFVWFVADQIRISLRQGDKPTAAIAAMSGIALLGKLVYEAITGGTLFVDSSTFVALVESHLAGAACGLFAGLLSISDQRAKSPRQSRIAEHRQAS